LPTEAEWEFAARGGSEGRDTRYAGSDNAEEVAWHGNNCDRTTQRVGQKMANELGLYDMSGNVWEWCFDFYGSYSSASQTDPRGVPRSRNRVRRGGAARYEAATTSVTSRYGDAPLAKHAYIGFRLALGPVLE
jgi:formylglycine-generating enzyme required for sulfatase activity